MTENDLRIARELKNRISRVAELVDFRVFGSRARGDANEYSDMDIFVEVEQLDKSTERLIHDIAWEVGFDNLIHVSPLIFTRYDVEKSPVRASFIVKNICEEGIVV